MPVLPVRGVRISDYIRITPPVGARRRLSPASIMHRLTSTAFNGYRL